MEIVPQSQKQDSIIQSYEDTYSVAKAMVASGYFQDAKSISQAIVKILAGREIGLGPYASMNGMNIIAGKTAFGANVMASKVKSSGRYNYRVTEMTDNNCSIEFMEYFNGSWTAIGTSSFSIADAKKAGTKNLDKFPRNMLFARAISNGVRWFCPDVMNGSTVYTPEELGADVDQDGNVIDMPKQSVRVSEPDPEPVRDDVEDGYYTDAAPPFVAVPEPVDEAEPADDFKPFTIEDACKVTNSKGVQYGTMTIITLEKMLSALWKQLKENHLEPEAKAEIELKIKAAQTVLTAKHNKEIS